MAFLPIYIISNLQSDLQSAYGIYDLLSCQACSYCISHIKISFTNTCEFSRNTYCRKISKETSICDFANRGQVYSKKWEIFNDVKWPVGGVISLA